MMTKEEMREYQRKYYERNKEKAQAYYAKNKDKISARSREYYSKHRENAEHKEEVSRRGKEYYQKHKEKRAAWRSAYRARKSHNGGNYTATEWEELLMRYDYTCLRCGRDDVKMTVDHVIPLDQGGTNSIGNIQCLCFSCNSAKGAKYADYRYL